MVCNPWLVLSHSVPPYFTNRIHLVVHHAARPEAVHTSVVNAEETCRSAGQDRAIAQLAQAEERDVFQMCRLVHAFESGGAANKEPAIRRGPDLSSSILQNRCDEFISQTFGRPKE
jgi:hypothetical protein